MHHSNAFYSIVFCFILFVVHCRVFLVLFCIVLFLSADPKPLGVISCSLTSADKGSRGVLSELLTFSAVHPCSLHTSTLHLYSFLVSPQMSLPAFHVTISLFCIHCHFICWPCHVSLRSLFWALIG